MPIDDAYPSRGPASPHKAGARERGRMRRRLRQQRRMREALLLDLGALVFELHRQGRREPELLQAKAAELTAVDQEVRALAHALEAGQTELELVSTGIAGSCANCGSLLSTDARYCPACGAPALPALGSQRAQAADATLAADPGQRSGAALDTAAPGSVPVNLDGETQEPAARPLDRIRGLLGRRDADG